jgi:hypothetical protein
LGEFFAAILAFHGPSGEFRVSILAFFDLATRLLEANAEFLRPIVQFLQARGEFIDPLRASLGGRQRIFGAILAGDGLGEPGERQGSPPPGSTKGLTTRWSHCFWRSEPSTTTRVRIKEKLKDWNRRGGLAGLALLERVIDGAAGLALGRSVRLTEGTTDAVRKAWREAVPEEPGLGNGQRFHLLFDDAIETLLSGLPEDPGEEGGTPGRLIVFVDDLDRCEESVVVQLLESIKLYLGSPRCVFLLAIDEQAVLSALERHWQGRSEDANREYLEKLFQAIVPVPAPHPKMVKAFLENQLAEHLFPGCPACADVILELLEPNPRKIKNFVNSACAGWGMLLAAGAVPASEEKVRIEFTQRFLLFQYLRAQHKTVWRLLERQPWALKVLGKVLTGTVPQKVLGVSWEEQRMLEHIFVRAFAHILEHVGEEADHHRYLPIAEAVELASQRIDRKRSDECFARYFRTLVGIEMDLPGVFLGLPPQPPAGSETMADLSIAEQSARAVALGQYARFLLKRYQRLELIEIGETDPVSLRQIFVPMQVGLKDLRDEEVGEGAAKVEDEKLPGEAAWDVLIRELFVALSGRPGSGKTTLVQAVVAELCNSKRGLCWG